MYSTHIILIRFLSSLIRRFLFVAPSSAEEKIASKLGCDNHNWYFAVFNSYAIVSRLGRTSSFCQLRKKRIRSGARARVCVCALDYCFFFAAMLRCILVIFLNTEHENCTQPLVHLAHTHTHQEYSTLWFLEICYLHSFGVTWKDTQVKNSWIITTKNRKFTYSDNSYTNTYDNCLKWISDLRSVDNGSNVCGLYAKVHSARKECK